MGKGPIISQGAFSNGQFHVLFVTSAVEHCVAGILVSIYNYRAHM